MGLLFDLLLAVGCCLVVESGFNSVGALFLNVACAIDLLLFVVFNGCLV